MQRQIIVSLILIIVLLGLGSGLAGLLIATRPQPPMVDTRRPPLVVTAVRLEPRAIIEPIVGYGTARADRYARLSVQVSGEIVMVADDFKPGAAVSKGQVLLRIDDREFREQVARARSMLDAEKAVLARLDVEEKNLERLIRIATKEVSIAQREYDRVAGLFENKQAASREFDLTLSVLERTRRERVSLENQKALLPSTQGQHTATMGVHEAEIELAGIQVERCTIRAPFDGRLHEVLVEIGERVTMGQPVFSMLDPDLIEVPISVPQRPKIGTACRLFVDSKDNVSWIGVVKRISPRANEATRTFDLYVEVNNAEHANELSPGQFVRAVIDGEALKDKLVVPRGTVQEGRVYVCKDGKAYPHNVEVERNLLDQTIIRGIKSGQIVITSNLDALHDGVEIQLEGVEAAAGGKTAASLKPQALPEVR